MHIMFYHPFIQERDAIISYDAIHHHAGFSGTETALIEMSKYMIDKGHRITIVGMTEESFKDEASGIQFIKKFHDGSIFKEYKYLLDVDWFSPIFWVCSNENNIILDHLNPQRTKVLLWLQCFVDDKNIEDIRNRGFDVYAQTLTSYVRNHYLHIFDDDHVWIIGNAISPYFCINDNEYETNTKVQGSWIFHAVYERGGHIAKMVYQKVQTIRPNAAQQLNLLSYYSLDAVKHRSSENNVSGLVVSRSLSKRKVAKLLKATEYFIYPLILPNNNVHHDTFGSVILESLAAGVIVITFNVACIPCLYGDYVVGINVPSDILQNYDPNARFAQNEFFSSQKAIDMLVNAVLELEKEPRRKEEIRKRGMIWARDKFHSWDEKGKHMESELVVRI